MTDTLREFLLAMKDGEQVSFTRNGDDIELYLDRTKDSAGGSTFARDSGGITMHQFKGDGLIDPLIIKLSEMRRVVRK